MASSPTIKDRASEITDAVNSIEDLYDEGVIEKIQEIQHDSATGFELVVKSISKKFDVSQAAIKKDISQTSLKKYIKEREASKTRDKGAIKLARELLEVGVGHTWMYETWQKMHYGDEFFGKSYVMSSANGAISNTEGFHVEANGEAGSGKSHGQSQAIKLIPPELKLNGDISPMSLYYLGSLIKPGTIVRVDDIVWSDALGKTVKNLTTDFTESKQKPTVTDGVGKIEEASARLTFWVSSVDSQADEQIRDRYLRDEVDNSETHIKEVKKFMAKKAAHKIIGNKDLEFDIKVCHEIVRAIHEKGQFEVDIPFAEYIEIPGKQRAFDMFLDMIKAFTVFRFMIREKDYEGRLIATRDDFDDAVEIFNGMGGADRDKLSENERKILQAITDNGYSAKISEIVRLSNLGDTTVRQIIFGRDRSQQKRHGLLSKCPALSYDGSPATFKLPVGFKLAKDGKGPYIRDEGVISSSSK